MCVATNTTINVCNIQINVLLCIIRSVQKYVAAYNNFFVLN